MPSLQTLVFHSEVMERSGWRRADGILTLLFGGSSITQRIFTLSVGTYVKSYREPVKTWAIDLLILGGRGDCSRLRGTYTGQFTDSVVAHS